MLNLKKTAVAVLAFGSSAVFAGSMGPVCTPGSVTVPCASSAWGFGAQALYLQSSYSGDSYFGSTFDPTGTVETYNRVPYNWGWGFKLEASYHFSTGNDLNLNWYHLDRKTNFSRAGTVFNEPGATAGTATTFDVAATTKPQWDAVNLEFGQVAHFGEFQNLRFHGGLQWSRIENSLNATATFAGFAPTASVSNSLKYNGVGPRVGVDYSYNWGNGFGMYANGATALLVGDQKFTDVVTVTGPTGVAAGTVQGSATNVVPELEAKLGLSYTYALAQGDLSLDAGWMWVNYFNAVQNATGFGLGSTSESNFAVQGPYIGLKWVGNVV